MQSFQRSCRGIGLLVELNLDRIVFLLAMGFALAAGAFLAGL